VTTTGAGDIRRWFRVAAIAAIVATVGDLLMLYVANSRRAELGLVEPPDGVLWIGAIFGVVSIPFYSLGYRAAAVVLKPSSRRAARIVFAAGGAGVLIGAVIHGLTARFIHADLSNGGPAQDPMTAVVESPALVALWGVATLLIVIASLAFALAVRRGITNVPRALAWGNPAVLTVALALAGLATLTTRAFVVPAAPNLAHVIFFAACARVVSVDSHGTS